MTRVVKLSETSNNPSSPQYYSIFEFHERKVRVNVHLMINLINELGFRIRDGQLIREHNNILEPIENPQEIHRYIYNEVIRLEDHEFIYKEIPYVVKREEFINKWVTYAVKFSFAKNAVLNSLPKHTKPILKDKKDTINICFKNGVVEITKKGLRLVPIKEVKGCIWQSQIIDFEINLKAKKCKSEYDKFIWNLSGKSKENELKIQYSLGYLIHNYTIQSKNKIVILYDKTKKKGKQGGVGKDLLLQAISKVRRTTVLDGKNWKYNGDNSFFYQSITPDTQVVIISDPEYQSQFNDLFVKSQGPLIINRKFRDEMLISKQDIPKFALTSNIIFDASDSSNKRRQIPIVLDGYYRDMGVEQPIVKEHGSEFYDEWDDKQYNLFYHSLFSIAQKYLMMPTPRIEFDDLIRQRFENKHGLMGKFIIELTTPKCPKLISAKESVDSFIDYYIDMPQDKDEYTKEFHAISQKFGECFVEWMNNTNRAFERKRVNYKAKNGKQLKQIVYKIENP